MTTKTFEVKDNNVNGVRSISLLFIPALTQHTSIENTFKVDKKDNGHISRYNVTTDLDIIGTHIYRLNIEYDNEFKYLYIAVEGNYDTIYCKRGTYSNIDTFMDEALGKIYKAASYKGMPYHYNIYDAFIYNKDELCKIIRNKIANS